MAQARKKNFSEADVEVIWGEVEVGEEKKKHFIFIVSRGVTGRAKAKAWREVTDAANAASSVRRSVQEVKRK